MSDVAQGGASVACVFNVDFDVAVTVCSCLDPAAVEKILRGEWDFRGSGSLDEGGGESVFVIVVDVTVTVRSPLDPAPAEKMFERGLAFPRGGVWVRGEW